MKPTRILFIRHAETEFNREEREMGQLDSPPTAQGLENARKLGKRLRHQSVSAIYSSDLGCAKKTAEEISSDLNLSVKYDVRLRERHMGIFQGLTREEMEQFHPYERAEYRRIGSSYVIPEGESADQRLHRTIACLNELAAAHSSETILVVSHGGILMGWFEYVLGLPFGSGNRYKRPHVALNSFIKENDRWILETWGDLAHLESEPIKF